jgi:uncharacterized protein YndB with AHSA1/START domain
VHVACPPSAVFAVVGDPLNDPRWCRRALECEQVSGSGPQVGATYRVLHRPVRLRPPMPLEMRITAFDPPHRLALREEDEDGVIEVVYELRPEDGGTRLTQRDRAELTGLPRVFHPLARLNIGRHLGEQLADLKRLLERAAPA